MSTTEVWQVWEIDPECGTTINERSAETEAEALETAGLMKGTRLIVRPDGSYYPFDPPRPKPKNAEEWI